MPEHDVATAFEMGRSEISNGALLAKAEEQFDVLLTTDKQLRHQQKLGGRSLAILVLPHASWIRLQPHADKIAAAAAAMQPGSYSEPDRFRLATVGFLDAHRVTPWADVRIGDAIDGAAGPFRGPE